MGGLIWFFRVTPEGTIDYDASLDGSVFSGRGTCTLSVTPHAITIDATGLTETSLLFYDGTIEPSFNSKVIQHLQLASTGHASYRLTTAMGGLIGFFRVTPDGTIDYDAQYNSVFYDRNTSILVIVSL
jgi:hypothetical protein